MKGVRCDSQPLLPLLSRLSPHALHLCSHAQIQLFGEDQSQIAAQSSPKFAEPPTPGDSFETDTFLVEVNEILTESPVPYVEGAAIGPPPPAAVHAAPHLKHVGPRPLSSTFKVPFKVPSSVGSVADDSVVSMLPAPKRRKMMEPDHTTDDVLSHSLTESHDGLAHELLQLVSSGAPVELPPGPSRRLPPSQPALSSTRAASTERRPRNLPSKPALDIKSPLHPARGDAVPSQLRCTTWPQEHDYVCFPSSLECQKLSATHSRHVHVPPQFESLSQYQNVLSRAVIEELNLRLLPLARKYHEICQSAQTPKGPTQQASFRSRGVRLYTSVGLQTSEFSSGFHSKEGHAMKNIQYVLKLCRPHLASHSNLQGPHRVFMNLTPDVCCITTVPNFVAAVSFLSPNVQSREHYSSYARDDLWVVFCHASMPAHPATFLARSMYHGPNSTGSVELAPLEMAACDIPKSGSFSAINLGNFSSEFSQLDLIASLDTNSCPVLLNLLRCCPAQQPLPLSLPSDAISQLCDHICASFHLNADQFTVLSCCLSWFGGDEPRPDPIQLGSYGPHST
jgi:hypothetical protein